MAKDNRPANGRSGGGSRGGSGSRPSPKSSARPQGGRGRTRPVVGVVEQKRPWGLIAAAVVVVVLAVAVLWYAIAKVNAANADKITSPDQITGLATYEYANGQSHVTTAVDYTESPPVGGPHDPEWADCTGTVYTVDIRHENAVHGMEHGAVWITYNPDTIASGDLEVLEEIVDGNAGLMLSPYAGLTSPISLQSWNHQLFVDSASDARVQQYVDFFTLNDDYTPEVGASCENADFIADPLVVGDSSRSTTSTTTDAPTTGTATSSTAAASSSAS